MLREIAASIKDNIAQKARNPFLGTFVIVWIIRNWKFVYSLFNFDKDCTLNDKIGIIESYFIHYSAWGNLGICVLISFLVLLITYTLISLSRLIVNFYDKIINPQVYKLTDKSSIVLKSDYLNLRQELIKLEAKLEEERESKLRIQNDYENLEKRLSEKISQGPINISTPHQEEKENQNDEKVQEASKSDLLLQKLKKDNRIEKFEEVASNILNEIPMEKHNNSNYITEFTSIGLIEPGRLYGDGKYYYKLKSDGQKVYDTLLIEKLR